MYKMYTPAAFDGTLGGLGKKDPLMGASPEGVRGERKRKVWKCPWSRLHAKRKRIFSSLSPCGSGVKGWV